MINAVFLSKKGTLTGFSISGHAMYDTYGNDIVCASVSSAVQMTANLITDGFNIKALVNQKDGKISLRVTDSQNVDTADIIIKSFMSHLSFISEDYKGTITITISEV